MEGVESVRQVDDTTLEWTAQIAGVEKHWRATITEQRPGRADRLDRDRWRPEQWRRDLRPPGR